MPSALVLFSHVSSINLLFFLLADIFSPCIKSIDCSLRVRLLQTTKQSSIHPHIIAIRQSWSLLECPLATKSTSKTDSIQPCRQYAESETLDMSSTVAFAKAGPLRDRQEYTRPKDCGTLVSCVTAMLYCSACCTRQNSTATSAVQSAVEIDAPHRETTAFTALCEGWRWNTGQMAQTKVNRALVM